MNGCVANFLKSYNVHVSNKNERPGWKIFEKQYPVRSLELKLWGSDRTNFLLILGINFVDLRL